MSSNKFLFLVAGFVFAASFSIRAQTLTNGLVAFYPFNGNVNDASGNGNHGVANDVSFGTDRFGMPNRAGSFAGNANSNVKINSTSLNLLTDFTVSVWI